jgi:hypothetical protein
MARTFTLAAGRIRFIPKSFVEAVPLGGLRVEDGGHQALDRGGYIFGGGTIGGLDPFAGGAVDGPAGGRGQELGGGCRRSWACGGMVADPVEEHAADYGDDGGLHVRGHLAGGGAVGGGVLGEGLGEEVADAEDDAGEGVGAGAVEDDAALGEEGVEAAGDHALEERELVGIVSVEGGTVDAGGVGDLLDGELVEVAGAEESGEGLLEELSGAADARVLGFQRQGRGF